MIFCILKKNLVCKQHTARQVTRGGYRSPGALHYYCHILPIKTQSSKAINNIFKEGAVCLKERSPNKGVDAECLLSRITCDAAGSEHEHEHEHEDEQDRVPDRDRGPAGHGAARRHHAAARHRPRRGGGALHRHGGQKSLLRSFTVPGEGPH